MPEIRNLVAVKEWGGKFVINDAYRPIAEALIQKYFELSHIKADEILFVENVNHNGFRKGRKSYAQIAKIPDRYREIIEQMTGRHFYYLIELYKTNTEQMEKEQVIALIYHKLKHIDKYGDLIGHDIEDWAVMVDRLGPEWASTRTMIPNLLDVDVNWDHIGGYGLFSEEVRINLSQSSPFKPN